MSDQKLTMTKAIELAADPDAHITLVREGAGPWHLRIAGEMTGFRNFRGRSPMDVFEQAIQARVQEGKKGKRK